jgi:hypothetical protein
VNVLQTADRVAGRAAGEQCLREIGLGVG